MRSFSVLLGLVLASQLAGTHAFTCGNSVCETGENCASCPQDCTDCLPWEAGAFAFRKTLDTTRQTCLKATLNNLLVNKTANSWALILRTNTIKKITFTNVENAVLEKGGVSGIYDVVVLRPIATNAVVPALTKYEDISFCIPLVDRTYSDVLYSVAPTPLLWADACGQTCGIPASVLNTDPSASPGVIHSTGSEFTMFLNYQYPTTAQLQQQLRSTVVYDLNTAIGIPTSRIQVMSLGPVTPSSPPSVRADIRFVPVKSTTIATDGDPTSTSLYLVVHTQYQTPGSPLLNGIVTQYINIDQLPNEKLVSMELCADNEWYYSGGCPVISTDGEASTYLTQIVMPVCLAVGGFILLVFIVRYWNRRQKRLEAESKTKKTVTSSDSQVQLVQPGKPCKPEEIAVVFPQNKALSRQKKERTQSKAEKREEEAGDFSADAYALKDVTVEPSSKEELNSRPLGRPSKSRGRSRSPVINGPALSRAGDHDDNQDDEQQEQASPKRGLRSRSVSPAGRDKAAPWRP